MASDVQVNGTSEKFIDTLDTEDPEYVRQMIRPVEVKEDVRQMEERKRVKLVLESRMFRDELEDLVVDKLFQNGGPLTPNSVTPQKLSDLLASRVRNAAIGTGFGPCIPISDVKSTTVVVDIQERTFRCKLASLYRLADLFGWCQSMRGGISGRISQEHEKFLLSSYGILPSEVTTSNLVKVNAKGDIIDTPSNPLNNSFTTGIGKGTGGGWLSSGVDRGEFGVHAAIYTTRPDARCLIHLLTPPVVAVSCLKMGLMLLSESSCLVGEVSYFEYDASPLLYQHKDKLRRALTPNNKVLFLRNMGAMVIGVCVEEAMWLAKHLVEACEEQISLVKRKGLDGVDVLGDDERRALVESPSNQDSKKQLFEYYMKHLDNAGYRTGYPYRDEEGGMMNGDVASVAEPPVASSFDYDFQDPNRPASRYGKLSSNGHYDNSSHMASMKVQDDEEQEEEEAQQSPQKWQPENTSTPTKVQTMSPQPQQPPPISPSKNAKSKTLGSPTKSTSSTEKELSPSHGSTSVAKEKKKKKGFFSSFNKKRDK